MNRVLCAGLAGLACALSVAAAPRPNVLLIAVDDLRTSLGCYGDTLAQSPHIDRFASTARLFNHAYAQQAVCGPSRTALLTGRLPDATRVWHNRSLFRAAQPDLVTLPQLFKTHGYAAVSLGKIFSGDERELDPVSWSEPEIIRQSGWKNYVLGEPGDRRKGAAWEAADVQDDVYPDGKLAALAVERLSGFRASGTPFFLAVGFFKPHLPFNAPKRYWDLYDPAVFALSDDDAQRVQGVSGLAYHSHRELAGYRDIPKDEHVDAVTARTLRHGYHACVSYIDAQVGRLLDALDRLDLARHTIVVLWGDHGFALGEMNRWCKGTNFEIDTRVPLLIRSPGLNHPGAAADGLVELVDVYPTLAELAALSAPPDLDGRSLVPMLHDPRASGRAAALSQFARPFHSGSPEFMGYSLRTATHRYTRWVTWPGKMTKAEEFYDYTGGPSARRENALWIEVRNIVAEPTHAMLRDDLSRKLDEMLSTRVVAPSETGSAVMMKQKKTKNKGAP